MPSSSATASGLADWLFTNRAVTGGGTRVAVFQVLTGTSDANTGQISLGIKAHSGDAATTEIVNIENGVKIVDLTASGVTGGLDLNQAGLGFSKLRFLIGGTSQGMIGTANGSGQIITGSVAGDFCFRGQVQVRLHH